MKSNPEFNESIEENIDNGELKIAKQRAASLDDPTEQDRLFELIANEEEKMYVMKQEREKMYVIKQKRERKIKRRKNLSSHLSKQIFVLNNKGCLLTEDSEETELVSNNFEMT